MKDAPWRTEEPRDATSRVRKKFSPPRCTPLPRLARQSGAPRLWRALKPREAAQGSLPARRSRQSTRSTSRSRGPQPACSRRVAAVVASPARARTRASQAGRGGVFMTKQGRASLASHAHPHGHRWARWLAPGWSAPWPWCSSSASFSVRCVHNTSQPLGAACGALSLSPPQSKPILTPSRLTHSAPAADTRASPRRCPLASKRGRCCLQPARTSGKQAHTWGFPLSKSCQAAPLTPLHPRLPPPQGGAQRVAAPDADVLRVPRSAGGHRGACAGVLQHCS
jgi:hypothetical protein